MSVRTDFIHIVGINRRKSFWISQFQTNWQHVAPQINFNLYHTTFTATNSWSSSLNFHACTHVEQCFSFHP